MKPGIQDKSFNPQAFAETVERVRTGQDYGQTAMRPTFDPKQAAEFRAESLHGRKIEAYRGVLENHGFSYIPDHELVSRGGTATGQGLWRHPSVILQLAFTPDDVCGMFASPEDFDRWLNNYKTAKRNQRRGIRLFG